MIGRWSDPRQVLVFHSVLVTIDVDARDMSGDVGCPFDGTLVGRFSFKTQYDEFPISSAISAPRAS